MVYRNYLPLVALTLLAGSSLACASGGMKLSFQKSHAQRHTGITRRAQPTPAPVAIAPIPKADLSEEEPLIAPKREARRASLMEMACYEKDATACHDFALSVMRVSTRPDDLERARRAMSLACEGEIGQACYEHALMVWLRIGGTYKPEALMVSMERARALGEPKAQGGYAQLVSPAPLGKPLAAETLQHYDYACNELWLGRACDLISAQASLAQPPVAQKLPEFGQKPMPPKTGTPSVSIASLSVAGTHDQASVKEVVAGALPQIQFCYQQALAQNPKLVGDASWTLSLDPQDGKVSALLSDNGTLQDGAIAQCAKPFIESWRFGKTEAPSVVMLKITFAQQ